MQKPAMRRIVVTGVGVVTPLGNDVDAFWNRLCAGESGVQTLTTMDTSLYKVHFGGEVAEFESGLAVRVKQKTHRFN